MVLMETGSMQYCPSELQHKELRDVWNHASFLVHIAYDLNWAVSQFEILERRAPNCLIKAILLLNVGITSSLMAEYRHAEKAFQKVLPLHPFLAPLAHFLLGVVRFELADYEQAQISFKLCAYILKQTDHNRSYHHLGLDFTLSRCLVAENEEIAAYEWTLKQKGRYGFRLLNRMPASLVFNSTALNNKIEVCCDRAIRPHTPRSAASSSVFSTPSVGVLSTTNAINNPASGPISDLTRTSPVIPWRPFKKPMVPRSAQAETSNLRSLTHFLKYTGPEDPQATREKDVPNTPAITLPAAGHASVPTRRTGSVRQALLQVPGQADMSNLLRKASTLTLKKTSSIRQMTKSVFNTPIEQLGAANVDQSRGIERGRVIVGPQHQPAIGTITRTPNHAVHRAVFGTIAEDSREANEQQQVDGRTSLDSHLIFSHGRLMM